MAMRKTGTLGQVIAFVTLAVVVLCEPLAAETRTWSLRPEQSLITVNRVASSVEVGGDLMVVQENKVNPLKLEVVANMDYDERVFDVQNADEGPWHSIRHYRRADAAIRVENDAIKPTLTSNRRLIGVKVEKSNVTMYCPEGPLSRNELDLIDLQGNSLLLDRLLPLEPVAIGDAWEHSDDLVTAFLRLDAISSSDVTSKLVSVKDRVALMETGGRISGAVGGVSTEIQLKAKYQFRLDTKRIVWFGLLIQEKRSVGHVGPGLDVVARIQMTISQVSDSPKLSNEALQGVTLTPDETLKRLSYESLAGGWQFANDRRWFITSDEADKAVLRMIDRGELVAQCNVSSLPVVDANKLIGLTEFQEDIKRGLGESFGQFVSAAERPNETDYRILHVIVDGEASEVPIRWIYHLLADAQGRQAVFVFIVEGDLIERFGRADEGLIETVRLTDRTIAAVPDNGLR
jgi:hypothetical protein